MPIEPAALFRFGHDGIQERPVRISRLGHGVRAFHRG